MHVSIVFLSFAHVRNLGTKQGSFTCRAVLRAGRIFIILFLFFFFHVGLVVCWLYLTGIKICSLLFSLLRCFFFFLAIDFFFTSCQPRMEIVLVPAADEIDLDVSTVGSVLSNLFKLFRLFSCLVENPWPIHGHVLLGQLSGITIWE